MEKIEKKLLDTISLSTIVIALGTLGIMLVEIRDVVENKIIPEWAFLTIMSIVSIVSLAYAAYAIIRYHHK